CKYNPACRSLPFIQQKTCPIGQLAKNEALQGGACGRNARFRGGCRIFGCGGVFCIQFIER
ncbi:hypothetical protein, partial [Pseudomonas aeruginosa]|uniref:hypothetical protein n=1 Tax=Pseudomonas aeruginosa TaxID=287 RepID=UPI001A9F41B4